MRGKMRRIKFSETIPGCDRRHYLTEEDVMVVLSRLPVVNEKTKSERMRFAREKFAQEFADRWRKKLWSEHFDHPDPVHNAPVRVVPQAV
jgi:hypothetical protein